MAGVIFDMLPQRHRLHARAANFIARRGRGVSGSKFGIKWIFGRGVFSQATVVVPIAFDKRANKRNRIKRQIREILKPLLPRLHPTIKLMVFVKKPAAGLGFQELKEELIAILRRIKLIT